MRSFQRPGGRCAKPEAGGRCRCLVPGVRLEVSEVEAAAFLPIIRRIGEALQEDLGNRWEEARRVMKDD